jgi:hypothetical protein
MKIEKIKEHQSEETTNIFLMSFYFLKECYIIFFFQFDSWSN